jgi:outer membrane protein TolC
MDMLPSLNFGADANIGFGRSINPVSNLITFKQNLSNSYSLNSNFQLFNGFTTLNTISANKFMLKAGLESEKITRNTLIIDILGQYYQVLYARGLENASKLQLELSEKQHYRILKMVETGREALSKQYEMESQVSADKLAYTIAHNSASQAITTMKQASLSSQLKNNNSQAVYLSLNIPIFNNYTIGRNIRNAKIHRNDVALRLELEKNNLYTEIENACLDYNRGRDEFIAAQSNFEFNKKSFSAVEKKFESGLVDVTDYSAAKTTLYRAESEALRTKLQLLIRKLTINFYTTGEYQNVIFN